METDNELTYKIEYIFISDIEFDENHIRKDIDSDIEGLAQSIAYINKPLFPPVVMNKNEQGKYKLVTGYRRIKAEISNGKENVSVISLDNLDEEEILLLRVIENLQRKDLTHFEKCNAFRRLKDIYEQKYPDARQGGTHGTEGFVAKYSKILGKTEQTIYNYLCLQNINPELRASVSDLQINHLKEIAGVPIEYQKKTVERVKREKPKDKQLKEFCNFISDSTIPEPIREIFLDIGLLKDPTYLVPEELTFEKGIEILEKIKEQNVPPEKVKEVFVEMVLNPKYKERIDRTHLSDIPEDENLSEEEKEFIKLLRIQDELLEGTIGEGLKVTRDTFYLLREHIEEIIPFLLNSKYTNLKDKLIEIISCAMDTGNLIMDRLSSKL